jgi:O-glycosyl hydrolase
MSTEKWLSGKDLKKILLGCLPFGALILLFSTSTADAQTNTSIVNVDGSMQYQTIRGLGGQMESHFAYENDTEFWDLLFKDVGVSAIRAGSATVSDLAGLNSPLMNEEVWPVLRLAQKYGQTLFGGFIHAKPEWKSPAIVNGGTLLPQFYDDYANEMVSAINIFENNIGATCTLNSPIPEPGIPSNGDPTSPYLHTTMTPTQYRDLIKVYGPIVKAAKPDTKIYAPLDWNVDESINYANIILSNPEARRWIDGLATNGYGTLSGYTTPEKWIALAALAKRYNLTDIWVPEQSHCCSNETADPAGLVMAGWLHDALALGNVNIWQTQLLIDKGKYNQSNITGLVFSKSWPCVKGVCEFPANGITKDGYAFKQFAHWVRPGAVRVNATSDNSEILVSSYWHPPDHTFTIVAINKSNSEKPVNFKIANVQGIRILDIFRTSVSENTANLGSLGVLNNSFSYKLAAQSITTFAGSTAQAGVVIALPPGGAATTSSPGASTDMNVGYAKLAVNSGERPYGTAVISYKENGVVTSELGVSASPPASRTRVFIEYQNSVAAVPGRSDAGTVDINTGIAAVNYSSGIAHITYSLRDSGGGIISTGHGTLSAAGHFAKFINELKDTAPDFNFPADFPNSTRFGSLDISSDQPLSVIALRMTTNQMHEPLFTTTPIANLDLLPNRNPAYFPQLVDGGGYTTSLFLLNTSTNVETGRIQIIDNNGIPMAVNQVGGTSDSSFRYAIPPNGNYQFQTDGFPVDAKAGWLRLIPDAGTLTPVASGVFRYNPEDVLVTESGIAASKSTNHARIYCDLSGNHNTGLAIANLSEGNASIQIRAFQSDGTTEIGASSAMPPLPGNGHAAKFADEFITGLPSGFTGVIDIASATPFAALTLRSLKNERDDFLITSFPVADYDAIAPSPVIFPQFVDGGGYITQSIFLSSGSASSTMLGLYGESGDPLALGN